MLRHLVPSELVICAGQGRVRLEKQPVTSVPLSCLCSCYTHCVSLHAGLSLRRSGLQFGAIIFVYWNHASRRRKVQDQAAITLS